MLKLDTVKKMSNVTQNLLIYITQRDLWKQKLEILEEKSIKSETMGKDIAVCKKQIELYTDMIENAEQRILHIKDFLEWLEIEP